MRTSIFTLVLLAACAAPQEQASTRGLTPDEGGLQPHGTELRIDFGRARDGVVETVEELIGGPPRSRTLRTDCALMPVEIVSWKGLELVFLDGTFRGWRKTEGPPPLVAGMTCDPG
ncbi:hypothetical protein SAMN05216257_101223 [Meinhardsimonia xiamenensis]|uniref:Uncharacterized protein n=1 Tax=Meinhardsimonia xiamenensis TaxID=990712 RepID=A0A1G8Y9E0_9RHOB|nr:hypothetical protein [Meinhardsimonia xiamenensis]PRX37204.1 hypothetical protein LV81_00979 [Meinhardsimonia xiamenensis]SDJ99034.1 hypothetical protein SAMN05216257_101223 [Meinhardsimonia xiamenensis]